MTPQYGKKLYGDRPEQAKHHAKCHKYWQPPCSPSCSPICYILNTSCSQHSFCSYIKYRSSMMGQVWLHATRIWAAGCPQLRARDCRQLHQPRCVHGRGKGDQAKRTCGSAGTVQQSPCIIHAVSQPQLCHSPCHGADLVASNTATSPIWALVVPRQPPRASSFIICGWWGTETGPKNRTWSMSWMVKTYLCTEEQSHDQELP